MIHEPLAAGRWHQMTVAEQLGNVGSEYERVVRARQNGNKSRQASALGRYLELLDLTIADPRWNAFRKKELLRLREASCQGLMDGSLDFHKYFFQFALFARKNNLSTG